jgi:Acyl-CoA dehydrogenase, C-terminal domain
LDVSWVGAVVVEHLMRTRDVVVGDVRAQEPPEMRFVQNEEVVEALATDGPDEWLHKRILPGCPGGSEDLVHPHPLDSSRELLAVDAVSITEQILRDHIVRKRLDKLPRRPDCRGMIRDVDVEEVAAIMPPDDEDEEQAEGEGAVQVFGGRGCERDQPVERLYREIRRERILNGTSEIQRLIVGGTIRKRGLDALLRPSGPAG